MDEFPGYLCLTDLLDQDLSSYEYFQTLAPEIQTALRRTPAWGRWRRSRPGRSACGSSENQRCDAARRPGRFPGRCFSMAPCPLFCHAGGGIARQGLEISPGSVGNR